MAKLNRSKSVTQVDIAAVANCSQNTVALALRGSNRISDARRREIVEIARRMGYRPNLAARSLRRGRSGLIGIFTAELDDPRTAFVKEMVSSLHTTRYKPILGTDELHVKPWFDAPWIQTFLELQVEALVSFAWHDVPRLPDWHDQVPIIMSGNQPDVSLSCDAVSVDRSKAARMTIEYLLSKGHRRVAMVQPYEAWEYTEGYREAMTEAGLKPRIWTREREKEETDAAHHRRFLEDICNTDDRPTAAFVLDSPRAADLCRMAVEEGLRVPEDLAVVGCGYMPVAEKLYVPLTTIERPIDEIVSTTIQLVRNRLENPNASPMHIQLPYRLSVRVSA